MVSDDMAGTNRECIDAYSSRRKYKKTNNRLKKQKNNTKIIEYKENIVSENEDIWECGNNTVIGVMYSETEKIECVKIMKFMNIVDNVVIDDNPMIEYQMNSDGTWTCGNIHTSIGKYLLEKRWNQKDIVNVLY